MAPTRQVRHLWFSSSLQGTYDLLLKRVAQVLSELRLDQQTVRFLLGLEDTENVENLCQIVDRLKAGLQADA